MRLSFSAVCILSVASLCPVIAQSFSVGVKGGFRITDEFSASSWQLNDESKRYTVGPTLNVRLAAGLALEFDALYRREGYTAAIRDFNYTLVRERTNSWEFPIIAKYRLSLGTTHPYVGVGYAPRVVKGSYDDGRINYDLSNQIVFVGSTKVKTSYDTTHGVVIGGGFELRAYGLTVAPEVRYTRWNKPFLDQPGSHGALRTSQQNQVEMLFGITWH